MLEKIFELLKRILGLLEVKSDDAKPDWIIVAEKELGVKEAVGSADNPRVLEYHQATILKATDDSVPWCAAFVNWVLMKTHMERSHQAAARSFLGVGQTLRGFKKHSVVILKRGNSSWQGHVGFAMDETKTHVLVLGGNQGDKVSKAWYSKEAVLGYRWPTPEQQVLARV